MSDAHQTPASDEVDVPVAERPGAGRPFEDVVAARASRRGFLRGALLAGGLAATPSLVRSLGGSPAQATSGTAVHPNARMSVSGTTGLTFPTIAGSAEDAVIVPDGYTHDVVIRWGDSIMRGVPSLDTSRLADGILLEDGAHERQAGQFGYNCDAAEYFGLPFRKPWEDNADDYDGILCVNHEYTNDDMLFPGWDDEETHTLPDGTVLTGRLAWVMNHPESVRVALAAHGVSCVRVRRTNGAWGIGPHSYFNRRITGMTPCEITGPAAGHELLRTEADPTGRTVLGTLNNCAAGQTAWGTYLSAEENFDQYFGNFDAYAAAGDPAVIEAHRRIPLPGGASPRGWEAVEERFDVARHPNEAFRFGWVVEIDPYNPGVAPKKRTAMGRFKHECATSILSPAGHAVVYSGDDARMEYMYKFVSEGTYNDNSRAANLDLLDSGTLYVAKLEADGTGTWVPLVWGQGPLTAENGFASQAEVLINTRAAADLVGATPMDRPEDFEANPVTRKVYCALTNNSRRTFTEDSRDFQGRELSTLPDFANPRGPNIYGGVLEITEANDDNAATSFTWEIFIMAGDPASGEGHFLTSMEDLDDLPLRTDDTYYAGYANAAEISPMGSPDNLGFDAHGNLWIVTDGSQPLGTNNGCFAVPTQGPERGKLRQFMSGPVDSEVCGCEFTTDGTTLFLNIQHPGDGGPLGAETSHWPDGGGQAPRPSLIAVRRTDGGRVGS